MKSKINITEKQKVCFLSVCACIYGDCGWKEVWWMGGWWRLVGVDGGGDADTYEDVMAGRARRTELRRFCLGGL